MNTKQVTVALAALLQFTLNACAQTKQVTINNTTAAIAFPGAEGYGKYTTGGRGGKVLIVTNLNDDGPGSFREAAEAKGKRIVVFAVSGTIHLEKKLFIKGDITVAGQTAPGDGICFADQPVSLAGDNIIVRYIRVRMVINTSDKKEWWTEVVAMMHLVHRAANILLSIIVPSAGVPMKFVRFTKATALRCNGISLLNRSTTPIISKQVIKIGSIMVMVVSGVVNIYLLIIICLRIV